MVKRGWFCKYCKTRLRILTTRNPTSCLTIRYKQCPDKKCNGLNGIYKLITVEKVKLDEKN